MDGVLGGRQVEEERRQAGFEGLEEGEGEERKEDVLSV